MTEGVPVQKKESPKLENPANKRQQDKIIAVLNSGNFNIINENQVELEKNEREEFLKKVAGKEIDEEKFKELIVMISPSHPTQQQIYGSINRQVAGLIAYYTREDLHKRDELNSQDIDRFINTYTDPIKLDEYLQKFLADIERSNSQAKRKEYEESIKNFTSVIFGKRQEYYDQIKLLRAEAEQKYPELVKKRGERINEFENFKIERVTNEEAEKILEKTEIRGDELKEQFLTRDILKSEGLFPKHKVKIGDSLIWMSSAYKIEGDRMAVVAYVEHKGRLITRSYYRSNSQGVWRYLPDYVANEEGKINWYGKGYGEESITLPPIVQKALSEITHDNDSLIKPENPDLIFVGTTRKLGVQPNEYYKEIEASSKKMNGNFHPDKNKRPLVKTPPEQIVLKDEEAPDFTKMLTSWGQKTGTYGEVSIEIFASKNNKLRYMFCRDTNGRVWIGGIENDSEIQSSGLRKSWIDGGDLTTPAYEYKIPESGIDQTGGYGNDNMKNGHYVDMFENYLKKIPIIQEYMKARPIISTDSEPTI